MRLLLDTHTLLWMLADDPRLSMAARAAIDDPANEPLVSAVSAYEIVYKHQFGKLPGVAPLVAGFDGEIRRAGCQPLAISLAHSVVAGGLDPSHRDPFDRLLIAQALVEGVPIVSNERLFDAFGVTRLW